MALDPDAQFNLSMPMAIEQKGIEHINEDERRGKPRDLFWMWAGTVWNVEFVVYGTLIIVIFGLSFAQAVSVILIGNLFYIVTGLVSLQGPATGTTTFGVSRAPFGPTGNRLPSLFNWMTQVGFGTVGLALIVLAAMALLAKVGIRAGDGLKLVLVVAAVAIQMQLPLIGHAAILRVLRWLALPFAALFVLMTAITVGKAHPNAISHGAGWGSVTVAMALVISAGGLGWSVNANDYSRYLPTDTDKRRLVGAVFLGCAIPSILLEILGAAIATTVPPARGFDVISVNGLASTFPGWFVWPYLIFAIIQLFAINSVDLYSSGVTLQSLGLHLKRYHCILIDSAVCGGLTFYAIFSARFSQLLADFLLFIIVWVGPWCAIYLLDYLLRQGRYDKLSLQNERGGLYYRSKGIHWPAVFAQLIGMAGSVIWLNAYSPYVSPLSMRFDGSDLSVFTGIILGGTTYYLLGRKSIAEEQKALSLAR